MRRSLVRIQLIAFRLKKNFFFSAEQSSVRRMILLSLSLSHFPTHRQNLSDQCDLLKHKFSKYVFLFTDNEGTQIRLAATMYTIETKSRTETRMVLFDLNRWYAEQMPSSIEETSVVLTRTGVVRALLDLSVLPASQLITVKILQDSVEAYTNPAMDSAYGHVSVGKY